VKIVILGAGQGKRLLPLTVDVPKALLDIHGRSLIGRQIDAFVACGLKQFVVVTGYGAQAMEEALDAIAVEHGIEIRTVYNPFYAVADNLASCWMARTEMDDDFVQVNGDTLFRAELVRSLLKASDAEGTAAINRKARYDGDDMKVMLDGGRLTEVGKTLPLEAVDAEAIGLYVFRGKGPGLYREVLERAMREPAGLKQWFPAAVGQLAKLIDVKVADISGHEWGEVDFPVDLQAARAMAAGWEDQSARRPRLATS
jgi:L-glutamine-phosphate cytidylyltransferase